MLIIPGCIIRIQIDRGKCEGTRGLSIHGSQGMQCLPVRCTLANYLFWLNLAMRTVLVYFESCFEVYKCIFPSVIRLWNSLPLDIASCNDFNKFDQKLKYYFCFNNKFYICVILLDGGLHIKRILP